MQNHIPGEDPSGCPCPICTPLAAGGKDRGMVDTVAVNCKWDGTGCAGMEKCPTPDIWPRAPIPS